MGVSYSGVANATPESSIRQVGVKPVADQRHTRSHRTIAELIRDLRSDASALPVLQVNILVQAREMQEDLCNDFGIHMPWEAAVGMVLNEHKDAFVRAGQVGAYHYMGQQPERWRKELLAMMERER